MPTSTRMPLHLAGGSLVISFLLACSGRVDGEAGRPPRGAEVDPAPNDDPHAAPPASPSGGNGGAGLLPLARLTARQFDNTVRVLLGDGTGAAAAQGPDSVGDSGFAEGGLFTVEDGRALWRRTEALAAHAVRDLKALTACADPPSDACIEGFIAGFGSRAFRRPLTVEEQRDLFGVYARAGELGHGPQDRVRVLLLAILQSPWFLYRIERGAQAATLDRRSGLVRLTPHEVASRLSYFLWSSMPDEALFAAAAGGRLSTEQDVDREARRMIAHPRVKETLDSFRVQWMHLEKLGTLVKSPALKEFTASTAASMAAESRRFFESALLEDGKFATLLTAPHSFIDDRLASIYGAARVGGSGLALATLDPKQRAGILTQPAFLALNASDTSSHPVKRGMFVWEQLLCNTVPTPPQNIPPPDPPAAGVSTRERFAKHGEAECARACHEAFDPIGFAFEHYDAIGRHRASDGGKPVDASGTLRLKDGTTRAFSNAVELVGLIAQSDDARRCFVSQWIRFALGRRETADDGAAIAEAYEAFARSSFDVRELLVAITRSRSFLFRRPAAGEVLQ